MHVYAEGGCDSLSPTTTWCGWTGKTCVVTGRTEWLQTCNLEGNALSKLTPG
jgi:hypothetical protein